VTLTLFEKLESGDQQENQAENFSESTCTFTFDKRFQARYISSYQEQAL
jgi:hypothetical protein